MYDRQFLKVKWGAGSNPAGVTAAVGRQPVTAVG